MARSFKDSDEMKTGMLVGVLVAILVPVLVAVLIIPSLFLDAFVVTKLWNWFVMNPFHTIKMHYALGLGLALLATFATRTYVPQAKGFKANLWHSASWTYLGPLMFLLTGYIVHHYV